MSPLLWAVAVLALLAVVSGVLVIEVNLRKAKRLDYERESAQWRLVETQIVKELAEPERQAVIAEAMRSADAQHAQLTHLCRTTSATLDAPAAVVTAVEHNGQRWLAYYGAEWIDEDCRDGMLAPLNTSFCQYVVATDEPLLIEDSLKDPRVSTATERTKKDVRAYLGAPVHSRDGVPIGSLCVFDFRPRRWSLRDQTSLRSFASLVVL